MIKIYIILYFSFLLFFHSIFFSLYFFSNFLKPQRNVISKLLWKRNASILYNVLKMISMIELKKLLVHGLRVKSMIRSDWNKIGFKTLVLYFDIGSSYF